MRWGDGMIRGAWNAACVVMRRRNEEENQDDKVEGKISSRCGRSEDERGGESEERAANDNE